jgi:hypothetical protein
MAGNPITDYSPNAGDTIIACASPKTPTGEAADVNVWVRYEDTTTYPPNAYARWVIEVSDNNYDGDIAFQVITGVATSSSYSPASSPGSPGSGFSFTNFRIDVAVATPMSDIPIPPPIEENQPTTRNYRRQRDHSIMTDEARQRILAQRQ